MKKNTELSNHSEEIKQVKPKIITEFQEFKLTQPKPKQIPEPILIKKSKNTINKLYKILILDITLKEVPEHTHEEKVALITK